MENYLIAIFGKIPCTIPRLSTLDYTVCTSAFWTRFLSYTYVYFKIQ